MNGDTVSAALVIAPLILLAVIVFLYCERRKKVFK